MTLKTPEERPTALELVEIIDKKVLKNTEVTLLEHIGDATSTKTSTKFV